MKRSDTSYAPIFICACLLFASVDCCLVFICVSHRKFASVNKICFSICHTHCWAFCLLFLLFFLCLAIITYLWRISFHSAKLKAIRGRRRGAARGRLIEIATGWHAEHLHKVKSSSIWLEFNALRVCDPQWINAPASATYTQIEAKQDGRVRLGGTRFALLLISRSSRA